MWHCRCNACGTYKSIMQSSLIHGKTKTCGCGMRTHGLTLGPKGCLKRLEYSTWIGAKNRCFNENSEHYADYGGRGITVCAGWHHDFKAFYEAMGPKEKGQTLERIKNDYHYSCGKCEECKRNGWPMNCKWETPRRQSWNRRSTIYLTYEGVRKSLPEWAAEMGWDSRRLWQRLFRYKMPIAMALSGLRTKKFQKTIDAVQTVK